MKIIYRGVYVGFPAAALHTGNLAYATDLALLFISTGIAWVTYYDYPDYQGEKREVYTPAEWAAKEGFYKFFVVSRLNAGWSVGWWLNYAVPAGKTLYITQFSYASWSTLAADADNNHAVSAYIENLTTATFFWSEGSLSGGGTSLVQPIEIPGGDTLEIGIFNNANHNCDIGMMASGFEV